MSVFQIEKAIPVPDDCGKHTGRIPIYPWAQMEVGDSFVAPLKATKASMAAGRKMGRKFVTRKISDTECRIWRAA